MSAPLLLLCVAVTLIPALGSAFTFPLHASCNIDWQFQAKCSDINSALVSQIHKWEGADNCKGGQKCLYELTNQTDKAIEATHETPVKHYVDLLTFTFSPDGDSCHVHGKSTSKTWYAVLDYGTNYCNLHNLITGAALDQEKGYKESTSTSVCTQYSSANCDKY